MKKLTKKLLSVVLAISVVFTGLFGLTACGGDENDPNTIYVSVINKGYGTAWINTMMKKFIASDSKYSKYKFEIINSYDDETTKASVESGLEYCNYDLVFHGGGSRLISEKYLADLSPVYNMGYKDGKLADYMDESIVTNFARTNSNDETYYTCIPWTSGGSGILVNYDLVSNKLGADWETKYPCRTTIEFLKFIDDLRGAGVQPFVIVANRNYYSAMYETWWAQYEGMQGVENYYNARYTDVVSGDIQEGPEAFLQQGVLQSLKVMEKIFSVSANYGSVYENWNTMQAAYMENKSAMIVNGSWMQYEMTGKLNYKGINMRFIKTPVISELGAKLGVSTFTTTTGVEAADINYNITDESKFIAVIDYVDAVLSGDTSAVKPAGVSNANINTIMEARQMVDSDLDYSDACVPSYSKKKTVAIEFLQYLYSEQGHKEYVGATKGLFLPVENTLVEDYDIELNGFASSHKKNLNDNAIYIGANMSWKFAKAGLMPFTIRNKGPVEYILTGQSGLKVDGVNMNSAYAIYKYNKSYYDKGNNWNLLVNAAK